MYFLPIMPYHGNLMDYWRANRDQNSDQDFWLWLRKQYKAEVDLSVRPERWKFKNKQDMLMFTLRWS
jgi:hypothetical protein